MGAFFQVYLYIINTDSIKTRTNSIKQRVRLLTE